MTAGSGEASTSRPAGVEQLDLDVVEKLDVLMDATLRHLESRLASGQGPDAWRTLLRAFSRSILPTFRVKFTQYLLWYMCYKVVLIADPHGRLV
jgi:RNA polymerase I specific transcription initiation factor RRN3